MAFRVCVAWLVVALALELELVGIVVFKFIMFKLFLVFIIVFNFFGFVKLVVVIVVGPLDVKADLFNMRTWFVFGLDSVWFNWNVLFVLFCIEFDDVSFRSNLKSLKLSIILDSVFGSISVVDLFCCEPDAANAAWRAFSSWRTVKNFKV